eukprot:gene3595-biopygen8236
MTVAPTNNDFLDCTITAATTTTATAATAATTCPPAHSTRLVKIEISVSDQGGEHQTVIVREPVGHPPTLHQNPATTGSIPAGMWEPIQTMRDQADTPSALCFIAETSNTSHASSSRATAICRQESSWGQERRLLVQTEVVESVLVQLVTRLLCGFRDNPDNESGDGKYPCEIGAQPNTTLIQPALLQGSPTNLL